ncbi:MAG: hypothetical protein ACRC62_20515 [Microcoleus sp.]
MQAFGSKIEITLLSTLNSQLSTLNYEGGHGGTAPTNSQLSTV